MNKTEYSASVALAAVAALGATTAHAAVVAQPVAPGAQSVDFGAGDAIDFTTGLDFGVFPFLDANAQGNVALADIVAGGSTVDGSLHFTGTTQIDGIKASGTHVGDSLYLPFELTGGQHPDYGFVTLDVSQDVTTGAFSYVLESATYDNTGAAILAGAPVSAVPEPSSLALLAAGAAGLAALRRRQRG